MCGYIRLQRSYKENVGVKLTFENIGSKRYNKCYKLSSFSRLISHSCVLQRHWWGYFIQPWAFWHSQETPDLNLCTSGSLLVGPKAALTFISTVRDGQRFSHSTAVPCVSMSSFRWKYNSPPPSQTLKLRNTIYSELSQLWLQDFFPGLSS